jgi:hypothetical protein|nr:MAG TPA: nucleoside triphosphate pyrophosphohydrolase [Caudoviricetes sp.]
MNNSSLELLEIYEKLNEWRAERHLSLENQRVGYYSNILEELGELSEAMRANDSNDYIDALCDIVVFAVNALEEYKYSPTVMNITRNTSRETLLRLLLHEIGKYGRNWESRCVCNIYNICSLLAIQEGYSIYPSMLETIKEINSRTGSYDPSIGKWIKDMSPEAQAKWYKANYQRITNA